LEELKKKKIYYEVEVKKIKNLVKRLEKESLDLRKKSESDVDERDRIKRMVERRNKELKSKKEDVRMMKNKMKDEINEKCEEIEKYEGVKSKKVDID
jgi:predicted  nucleic acid-binding Zn-ribbon protein